MRRRRARGWLHLHRVLLVVLVLARRLVVALGVAAGAIDAAATSTSSPDDDDDEDHHSHRTRRPQQVAVIFAGQLRVRDRGHFKELVRALNGTRVVIVTTPPYAALAKALVTDAGPEPQYCVIDELAKVPDNAPNALIRNQGWLNQHRALDVALRAFGEALAAATVVVRARTDVHVRPLWHAGQDGHKYFVPYATFVASGAGVVHAASDLLFYAESNVFTKAFADLYFDLADPRGRYAGKEASSSSSSKSKKSKGHKRRRRRRRFLSRRRRRLKDNGVGDPNHATNMYLKFTKDHGCVPLSSKAAPSARDRKSLNAEPIFSYHVQTRHRLRCAPLCTRPLLPSSKACPYDGRVEAMRLGGTRKERRDFAYHELLLEDDAADEHHPRCLDLLDGSRHAPSTPVSAENLTTAPLDSSAALNNVSADDAPVLVADDPDADAADAATGAPSSSPTPPR